MDEDDRSAWQGEAARAAWQVGRRAGGAKLGLIVAVIALVLLVIVCIVVAASGASQGNARQAACSEPGDPGVAPPAATGPIRDQQIANAKAIAAVTTSLHLSGAATLVTLTAAAGESDLINVHHGDAVGPDSIGLFQQRNSWGTQAQRLDPSYATTSFLLGAHHDNRGGLLALPGWSTMAVTEAIHRVQINADPNHYTRYIAEAKDIATAAGIDLNASGLTRYAGGINQPVGGTTNAAAADDAAAAAGVAPTDCGAPGADAGAGAAIVAGVAPTKIAAAAVQLAISKLGTPYVFGGGGYGGPTGGGFDCSSYVAWSYYQASGGKIQIGRDTYAQVDSPALKSVPIDQLAAGDLVYIHVAGDSQGGWNHVVMSIGGQNIVEEPRPPLGARRQTLAEYHGSTMTVRRLK